MWVVTMQHSKHWRKRKIKSGKVARLGWVKSLHGKVCNIKQPRDIVDKEPLIAAQTTRRIFEIWSWTIAQVD